MRQARRLTVPTALRRWALRVGWVPRRKGKSLVVWGASEALVDRLAPLLAAARREQPRLNLYVVAADRRVAEGLARRLPGAAGLPAPRSGAPGCRLLLARLKARLVIAGAPAPSVGAGCKLAVVGATAAGAADFRLVADAAEAARPSTAGITPERVLRLDAPEAAARHLLSAALAGEAERPSAGRSLLAGVAAARLALADRLVPGRRRIESLEDLRVTLGAPQVILCLGNGPSSEDPRLAALASDALFRVNDLWRERGRLTRPDAVFTGLRQAVRRLGPDPLYLCQTLALERRLFADPALLLRRRRYASIERLGLVDFGRLAGPGPSNGAVMIATAVALRPRKIVIAGIDLFEHPGGAYPGDAETPNAYTLAHERDAEVAFILDWLDRHPGEIEIVGEALAERWRAHRA